MQHRSDPAKVLGTILGWVFDPAPRALVRWQDVTATFEAADEIDDLAIVPAADESIAERICRKIQQGLLPMTAPVKTAFAELTQWRRCDGCNHLMAPGRNALLLEYSAPTRLVRLHRGCREFWVLACRAVKEQRRAAGRSPRMPTPPEPSERTGRAPSARRRAVRRRPVLPRSTLTVTRAALALLGLAVTALQPPVLTTGAMRALQPLLESEGFDLTHPVRVRELEDDQGFRLEQ